MSALRSTGAIWLFAVHAALSIALTSASSAAGYPDRAVKVIVPFPAGGVTDIATRLIAQKLSERLGQQFYIENIGGAGGNLGMANAAHAAGDGYTILFASSSIVVNPSLYKQVPFEVEKDFIPVTKAGASPNDSPRDRRQRERSPCWSRHSPGPCMPRTRPGSCTAI